MALTVVIHDVVFNYVKIKNPGLDYNHKDDNAANAPLEHKEYGVDVVPTAEWVKKLKKRFGKHNPVKKMRLMDEEAYKKAFKVDGPGAEYQNGDGEYSILTFTAFTTYSNGDVARVPEVLAVSGGKDAKGLPVGIDIEVGNGSKGKVQVSERTWENFGGGLTLDLYAIKVENLVPYEGGASLDSSMMEDDSMSGDDGFGNDGMDSQEPTSTEPATKPVDDEWGDE